METSTSRAKINLFKRLTLLLFVFALTATKSFAWHVDSYTITGCLVGGQVKVHAIIVASETNIYYHWQFKDATSANWKCFTNGVNSINGVNFTVSNAISTNAGSNPADLTIANATTALENVQVRMLMGIPGDPCLGGNTSGGDNNQNAVFIRLHIWTGGDCGGTTPGCLGNILNDASGYYGGFESSNNFSSTTGQTAFTVGTYNSSPVQTGRYVVDNNPYAYNTIFGQFAPHSGNNQMIVSGNTTATAKVWYKTVTVTSGATYTFSAWAAKIEGSTTNIPTIQLKVNGLEVATMNFTTSTPIGNWIQGSGTYIIPTGVTSLEIAIYDKAAATHSHNYSLDDICFRQSTPPPVAPMVGDFVWNDLNSNGKQDLNEPGIPHVIVTLYDANSVAVSSTETDAKGGYYFSGIAASLAGLNYKVGFGNLPTGFVFTLKNAAGTTSANNSDVNPATGKTDFFLLKTGETNLTIDAGAYNGGAPLPIRIIGFQGKYADGVTGLNWSASSAISFDYFEIERSSDAISFAKIGSVNGIFNQSDASYQYNDKQVMAGTNYYRLKLIDRDGQFSYSNVIAINALIKGISITAIYPNPFTDQVKVAVTSENPEPVNIRIMDNTGRLLQKKSITTQKGNNQLTLDNLGVLASGLYIIEVSTATSSSRMKLYK